MSERLTTFMKSKRDLRVKEQAEKDSLADGRVLNQSIRRTFGGWMSHAAPVHSMLRHIPAPGPFILEGPSSLLFFMRNFDNIARQRL